MTTTYEVGPGTTIATLLPLTNRSPELGHDTWDPDRWDRHRFTDTAGLGSPQLVTSFGHGKHSCPAQPFSLAAMTAAMTRFVTTFDLTAGWSSYPVPGARPDRRSRSRRRCEPDDVRPAPAESSDLSAADRRGSAMTVACKWRGSELST